MVEGPLVHRVAAVHGRLLIGKTFVATSPNGRFKEGANAITGRFVSLIEAHGKNIFYFFTRENMAKAVLATVPDDVVVVHIHFGLTGNFATFVFPGPEPRAKTRLRLRSEDETVEAHLTASICAHGDLEFYRKTIAKLGPDPLREDADKELLWGKMQTTRKTIGGILMDQSLVAGIGNAYRSEILFASGVHPDQPASTLSRSAFEHLWERTTRLFMVGMLTGNLESVYTEDLGQPYPQQLRTEASFHTYRQCVCKVCGSAIRTWTCAGRKVYACEACQPLRMTGERNSDEALADDVSIGRGERTETRSGLDPREDTLPPGGSDGLVRRPSSLIRKTKVQPRIAPRSERVVPETIAEYRPVKENPRNLSRALADLTNSRCDVSATGKGHWWTSARARVGLPIKYHSWASHSGQAGQEGSSSNPKPWQTITSHFFPTRKAYCIPLQVLGATKPQARPAMQAVCTLCLGSSSPLLF